MLFLEVVGIKENFFDFSGRGRGSHHPNWTSIQEDSGHCGEQAFLPEETDFLPRYPRLGGYYVVLSRDSERFYDKCGKSFIVELLQPNAIP